MTNTKITFTVDYWVGRNISGLPTDDMRKGMSWRNFQNT